MEQKKTISEKRMERYYASHEYRLRPDEPQQIEWRKLNSDKEWEPFAFYEDEDRALEVLTNIQAIGRVDPK
jgi:hypothetical protein